MNKWLDVWMKTMNISMLRICTSVWRRLSTSFINEKFPGWVSMQLKNDIQYEEVDNCASLELETIDQSLVVLMIGNIRKINIHV